MDPNCSHGTGTPPLIIVIGIVIALFIACVVYYARQPKTKDSDFSFPKKLRGESDV